MEDRKPRVSRKVEDGQIRAGTVGESRDRQSRSCPNPFCPAGLGCLSMKCFMWGDPGGQSFHHALWIRDMRYYTYEFSQKIAFSEDQLWSAPRFMGPNTVALCLLQPCQELFFIPGFARDL